MARPKGEPKGQIRLRVRLGLVEAVQARGAEWLEGVLVAALENKRLPDGYAARLEASAPVPPERPKPAAVKRPATGVQAMLDRRAANDEMWRRLNGKG